jgi:gliding motility-associated-like protein
MSLVASNGNCRDTATIVLFSAGTPHSVDSVQLSNYGFHDTNDFGTCMDDTPDGGFILGGYSAMESCGSRGLLVKLKEKGCIAWSKTFRRSDGCGDIEFTEVCASPDSSYYALQKNGGMSKLDKLGNLVWAKNWQMQGAFGAYLGLAKLTTDEAGFIYAIGPSINNGWVVAKIAPDGNMLWNRYHRQGNYDPEHVATSDWSFVRGIFCRDGKLYVTGWNNNAGSSKYFSFLTKIDASTGNTDWQYGYSDEADGPGKTSMLFAEPSAYKDLLLVAGHNRGQWANLIDTSGTVRKSIKAQFSDAYSPKSTKAFADKKGNIYIMQWEEQPLPLQPYFAYNTNIVRFDTLLNKHWGMFYATYPRGYFADAALNNKGVFAALGTDYGYVNDGIFSSRDFRYLQVDTPGLFSELDCNYNTTDFTLTTHTIKRHDFQWAADSASNYEAQPATLLLANDAYVQARYACPDFIDSCNLLKITGPRSLCSFANSYTYRISRNRKCALVPIWKLPAAATMVQQTDTTITVRFNGFGRFVIAASLQSCVPAYDSVVVNIIPKSAVLNLGRDTTICPNTAIRLHAGKTYLQYKWQDNSTDSFFTVSQPGLYWVQVIDSCGNNLYDSINIGPYTVQNVSVGPDRTVCRNDTLRLSAPSGFKNYVWSNNYNISSLRSQTVVVTPLVDTAYYIKAEKAPGCFAYDTVHITVLHSPVIDLGLDQSFCSGDSVTFDAGAGFSSYMWSTGETYSKITVRALGSYRIKATTAQGCSSYDTIFVRDVWGLPDARLDKRTGICAGEVRTLNPGNFQSYIWQDGSTAPTFTVSAPGHYFVQVKDVHGCAGHDSTNIKDVFSVPTNFLPLDTTLCSYSALVIKPVRDYKSYLWNEGSRTEKVSIGQPGTYWLQVEDNNGCIGKDSITIHPKDCMSGVYVPNAFSPNKDRKNDLFSAQVFGPVARFELIVYNRWGRVIFKTTDPTKGWDGRFSGIEQDSGTFIWMCRYRLEGEPEKMVKGTVVLIR